MTDTILQVEDDPDDIFLFEHAMRAVGVTNPIQVARDGQKAIDYLSGAGRFANRALFPLPCLVLLDLKLPHVMGLEVLRWIRRQPGTVRPVIVFSASGQESDLREAYQGGANAYLVKPSGTGKLKEMAKSIKDFWLTQNTPPPEAPPPARLEPPFALAGPKTARNGSAP